MCLPKACGIDEIGAFWTDVELISCLESIQNKAPEASLPRNVVADVNPYLNQPSNLSQDSWYIARSEDPKQTEVGFWKAKGDPCQILSDSSVVGSRTTLEFYEGHSPNGNRTDWVMQEYAISHKGSSKEKGAISLCRVFLSEREGETEMMDQNHAIDDVRGARNMLPDEDNKSGDSLMFKFQVEMEEYQAMPSHQGDNLLQADCFANGDYLEILDLLPSHQGDNPRQAECFANGDYLEILDLLETQSSPSSSENSSCLSRTSRSSDVYFDSVALLQELECEDEVCETKPPSYKFSISKPNEMVASLAAEGSPTSGNNKAIEPIKVEPSEPVLTLKRGLRDKDHIPENAKRRPPPASDDAGASSSGQKPGDDKGKKVVRGKTLKKFFCFIAF